MLDREEYIEQAHFFRALAERTRQNIATQDLLKSVREEILSTTKLPMAIDFLASELKLTGVFAPAMARLPHYFTPFQTFVVEMAENERGRFDFLVGLAILEREATYRAGGATPQGIFLYQFECLCRNRMGYDRGLEAVAADPIFDDAWRAWILTVRRQVGIVDFADLLYVRSEHYAQMRARHADVAESEAAVLFGLKEGRIALANRHKDPLLLFAALERHLQYPSVPRPQPVDEARAVLPTLLRRVERIESRLKLLEEEQKGGIDLTKFYSRPAQEPDEASDG
ncbi:MAG: hypothetical protein HYX69_12115 [Planctomycetia bacterium]|nr:hypothetical protein [Planctomycetia bacterium]